MMEVLLMKDIDLMKIIKSVGILNFKFKIQDTKVAKIYVIHCEIELLYMLLSFPTKFNLVFFARTEKLNI